MPVLKLPSFVAARDDQRPVLNPQAETQSEGDRPLRVKRSIRIPNRKRIVVRLKAQRPKSSGASALLPDERELWGMRWQRAASA